MYFRKNNKYGKDISINDSLGYDKDGNRMQGNISVPYGIVKKDEIMQNEPEEGVGTRDLSKTNIFLSLTDLIYSCKKTIPLLKMVIPADSKIFENSFSG